MLWRDGRDGVMNQVALPAGAMSEGTDSAPELRRWLPAFIAVAAFAALAAALAFWLGATRPPGDGSLEAGFARDMIVHHDQAVAMALLVRDETADPLVKSLATDIILTQQNQIGQMLGWLNLWGLSATSAEPPMAWMGTASGESMPGMSMPMTPGRMPGMATPEELAKLERLSGEEADAEFLRLMIAHHRGAIPMAEAAVERSDVFQVRALARSIVASQEVEIAAMEELLQQNGRANLRP